MTLSGGECLMQPDFAGGLLEGAHDRGINTAIETAGNVPWRFMEKVLPHVDTVLHDLKVSVSERHRKWTGVKNERILDNFKRAYETWPKKTFIARTPLIPGVNDDEEHIRAVLEFIRPHKNVVDYELLPYMRRAEPGGGGWTRSVVAGQAKVAHRLVDSPAARGTSHPQEARGPKRGKGRSGEKFHRSMVLFRRFSRVYCSNRPNGGQPCASPRSVRP